MWKFLERWPTAESVGEEDFAEIARLMNPLGLHGIRAQRIVKMSGEFSVLKKKSCIKLFKKVFIDFFSSSTADFVNKKDWKDPTELHGIGKYGSDSYRIFCLGEWKHVRPTDIMLKLYQDWVFTNSKVLKLDEKECLTQ